MNLRLMVCVVALGCVATGHSQHQVLMGRLYRVDPRMDELFPITAVIERLADGFDWAEGPVWNKADASLMFSDVPNNTVWKWKEGAGKSVFLKPSGYTATSRFQGREPGSNGLVF